VTSDLQSVEKATRDDNAKLREDNAKLREDNAKLREDNAKLREDNAKLCDDNEVVVGRSKKLCIVLHGLLDVKTTEITKMKALLTKLVHSLSEKKLQMEELVQSNLKLKTINVEALKSRDSLQVKLYNVVLEKQRSDTEMQALQTTTRALQTQVKTLQTQVQTLQDALAKSKKQNTTLVAFSKRVTSLTQTIDADLLR
jgi:cell division protein FtsB